MIRTSVTLLAAPPLFFSRFDVIREFKKRGRRRQRERRKTMGLMSKNNRSARAFYILVHFFANNVK